MASKEMKAIRAAAIAQGMIVKPAGGGHWKVRNPKTGKSMNIPSTPCGRTALNVIGRMRQRLDFVWEGRGASPRTDGYIGDSSDLGETA